MADEIAVGRIVHYVLKNGVCRPGIIVGMSKIMDGEKFDPAQHSVALQVFRDGPNDSVAFCGVLEKEVCRSSDHQPAGWPNTYWAESVVWAEHDPMDPHAKAPQHPVAAAAKADEKAPEHKVVDAARVAYEHDLKAAEKRMQLTAHELDLKRLHNTWHWPQACHQPVEAKPATKDEPKAEAANTEGPKPATK